MCMMDDVAQFYLRKLTPEEAEVFQRHLENQRPVKRCCETCKYLEEDLSVGAAWCENNDPRWTDEEVTKYYENGEEGCPHWKEDKDGES